MGCASSTLADVRTELEAAQAKVKEFEARGGGPPPSELQQACAKLSPAGAAKILEQVQAELQREAARELSAEFSIELSTLGAVGTNSVVLEAPPAVPERPAPKAPALPESVRGEQEAAALPQPAATLAPAIAPLEQGLPERMQSLAAKLGVAESALVAAEALEYAGTALDAEGVADLVILLGNGGLSRLERLGEIPVRALVADALEELDLSEKHIGPIGGMILAGLLPAASRLTKCNLEDNDLCSEGIAAFSILADALPQTKIRTLNIDSNGLGPQGAEALAAVLTKTDIQELSMAGNELCGLDLFGEGTANAEGVTKICEVINDTTIHTLDFSFNSVGKECVPAIIAMLKEAAADVTPYLTNLDLQGHKLDLVQMEDIHQERGTIQVKFEDGEEEEDDN
eukprot:Transcript_16966.p1 GENE.Transcript_16966~~Transcript_16966.p1  ORF type:complete len:400 (-),score=121.69 Transcript_16966:1296-2495(-)